MAFVVFTTLGMLELWQLETWEYPFPFLGGPPLVTIAASPSPSLYAVACLDNAVKYLNIGTLSIGEVISFLKEESNQSKCHQHFFYIWCLF